MEKFEKLEWVRVCLCGWACACVFHRLNDLFRRKVWQRKMIWKETMRVCAWMWEYSIRSTSTNRNRTRPLLKSEDASHRKKKNLRRVEFAKVSSEARSWMRHWIDARRRRCRRPQRECRQPECFFVCSGWNLFYVWYLSFTVFFRSRGGKREKKSSSGPGNSIRDAEMFAWR